MILPEHNSSHVCSKLSVNFLSETNSSWAVETNSHGLVASQDKRITIPEIKHE